MDVFRNTLIAAVAIAIGLFTTAAHAAPPVVVGESFDLDEGGRVDRDVDDNDFDPDGDDGNMEWVLVINPVHASSFDFDNNGRFDYRHDGSETTSDSFVYRVIDEDGESAVGTASFQITPVNDEPRIVGQQTLQTNRGQSITLDRSQFSYDDPDTDPNQITISVRDGSNYSVNGNTVTPDPGFSGTLSVGVRPNDGEDNGPDFPAVVNVLATNRAPDAQDDVVNVNEGGSVNGSVAGNDSDPDGDDLIYRRISGPAHANSFQLQGNGSFSYTHDGSETTGDAVVYEVDDGNGGTDRATLSIIIQPQNDPPVAVDDQLTVDEGGAGTVPVLANDSDPDGDGLSARLISQPQNGAIQQVGNAFAYLHDGSETTTDSFDYEASDGRGGTARATVNITIRPVNEDPVAVDDVISVGEGQTVSGNVLSNDTDPDGDSLQVRLVSGPAHSPDFSLQPNGSFSYPHDGSETTSDEFTYEAFDSGGRTSRARGIITITLRNDAPTVATPIPDQQVVQGQSFSLNVAGNFTDADGDSLTFSASGLPNGLSFSPAGQFSGAPTQAGNFAITVRARDPSNADVTDGFQLSVSDNQPPRIVGQNPISTQEETAVTIRVQDVDIEDPDSPPGQLSIAVLPGTNYTLVGDNRIQPVKDFFGNLTVRVLPSDEVQDGITGNITVSVSNVQDDPVAVNDTANVDEGGTVTGNVLTNDSDPDDDNLTARLDSQPKNGEVTLQPNGSFTYTHDGSETKGDSFNYLADDGKGNTDRATVTISVKQVNDAPEAVDDEFTVEEGERLTRNVLDNDSDPEGGKLDVRVIQDVSHGTLQLRSDGRATYVHDGSETTEDSFIYEIEDQGGLTSRATVRYAITPVNDPPTIIGPAPGVTLTTPEETPLALTPADFQIEDVDTTDPAAFSIEVKPGADYAVSGNVLTPAEDFNGILTVGVAVSDGESTSDPIAVEVTVTAVNDAPTITDQRPLETAEDEPLNLAPSDLVFEDPDNSDPADFVVNVLAGENYTALGSRVTPNPDFNGELSVPVQVSDGTDPSEPFTVTIAVTPVNDAPRVESPLPNQQVVEDSPVRIETAAAFIDVDDGDTLTYAAEGLPASGRLAINEQSGTISGTPLLEDTRDTPYPVTITATDGDGASVSDTFQLTVAAKDRANLSLAIEVSPSPGVLGDTLTWRLVASNAGPSPGDGIQVTGTVSGPDLDVQSGNNDCTLSAQGSGTTAFTCQLPLLPVGADRTVSIATTPGAVGDLKLQATVEPSGALPIDPNPENNQAVGYASVAREISNGAVQSVGSATTLSVTAGDINGDGFDDILLGTAAGVPAEVYFGNGDRGLDPVPALLPDNSGSNGVALADFDGDGDLDAVLANAGGAVNRVFVNDGSGVFSFASTLGAGNTRDVATGDFNGDGFIDIAFANLGGNTVWFNDGSAGFTQTAALGTADSQGVAVADFNNDGLDDLAFANIRGADTVYLTQGNGFGNPLQVNATDSADVVAADLDGDGDPDLAFATRPTTVQADAGNPVYINNGSGSFTLAVRLGNLPSDDILAADFNNDDRADLLFVSSTGTQQVYDGTSAGFVLADEQMVSPGALGASTGEFSQETGTDLVFANGIAGGADLFLNDTFGDLGLGDAIPPQLTLNGETTLEIPAGSAFQDPGATAIDNIDGDISSAVVIGGNLNPSVVGTYTVTYSVTDTAGNSANPISRTVRVAPAAGTGGGGGGATGPGTLLVLLGFAAGLTRRRSARSPGR